MSEQQLRPKRQISMGLKSPSSQPAAFKKGGFVKKQAPFGGPPPSMKKVKKGKSGC